jgi:hypothetical protein
MKFKLRIRLCLGRDGRYKCRTLFLQTERKKSYHCCPVCGGKKWK